MIRVLVVHHSMMGHTAAAAERLAAGVRSVPDADCVCKPVLAEGVIGGDTATREDFRHADALVLGCPVHQRNVSWEMKRFIDRATDVVPPAGEALQAVHDAYVGMASSGTVTAAQREVFFSAGRALLRDDGAEAIMLGGTDLALAFASQDPGFPVFDCAAVHADAIAEAAMA
jgi:multimeric flavodoxin WrbA